MLNLINYLNKVMLEKIIFPRELLEFEVANCARFSTSQLLRKDMLRLERAYNFDY